MKKKVKWIWIGICTSLLLIILLVLLFGHTILIRAGKFMAPQGISNADVAILQGCTFLNEGTDTVLIRGINLLDSGKVKRLIIVLHSDIPSNTSYLLNQDYPGLVKKEVQTLGLKEKDFGIVVVPISHPNTLTEAEVVLEAISKDHIKSAILLSHGFHTRRSYLVYQYIALPFQIKIFPLACLNSYEPLDSWWSHAQGRRYFVEEVIKLAYYLVRGYVPLKLSY